MTIHSLLSPLLAYYLYLVFYNLLSLLIVFFSLIFHILPKITMVQKVWRRNFAAGHGLEKALDAARSSSAPAAIQSPPGGSSPEEVNLTFENLRYLFIY